MTFTLYPAVDIRDGKAVRLTQGKADEQTVYDTDPVAAARRWADAGAEWLHVVDLDAAFTGEPRNRHLISDVITATGLPVQASGGIRTLEDVDAALGFGAQRVVIGTMALKHPAFVERCLERHGSPPFAVGLDAEGRTLKARGWTEEAGDLFDALKRFTEMGIERFVYTDITRDGMLEGPNVAMLTEVAEATDASITASGGISSLDDIRSVASCHPQVDAAIIGKALYAGRFTLEEALTVAGDVEG